MLMDRQQIDAVRAAIDLPAIIQRSHKLKRAGNEWKGCCPFHADRTPSFTVYFREHWLYHCHGCGAHGDGPDWLRNSQGMNLREVAKMVDSGVLPEVSMRAQTPAPVRSNNTKAAQRMFSDGDGATGSLTQAYLFARGINIAMPDAVRFARLKHPDTGRVHPVALFAVSDIDGNVQGVQRVYLADDGKSKLQGAECKLSLGAIAGGAIRFEPASVQIALAEGPETALSVQQMLGITTWATCGVQNLGKVRLPEFVRRVIIAADAGDAGENGAMAAARAYAAQGREVRIIRPLAGFADFNDELQGRVR